MTKDVKIWAIRLFIILAIGGAILQFLQIFLFGMLFGFASGADHPLAAYLASSISFFVLGFIFEALPVALFGKPKTSTNTMLQSRWGSGFLLAWLAMMILSILISMGLHLLLSKSGVVTTAAGSSRWLLLGISMIAIAVGSYALVFVLNLRFAQAEWGSDWHWPVWLLAGGQALWSIAMSFADENIMASAVGIGFFGQIVQAALVAYALGVWRDGIERTSTPSGNMVF